MKILKLNNEKYPKKLKEISNPPNLLYVEGNIDNLNTNAIAVVGSRKYTEYGEKWCKIFTQKLIQYDLTIVSGMALGIDSIAHLTAIEGGARTIAVLPSGLNNIYPKENNRLYKKILENGGTVITEYNPETEATYNTFLNRNRLVSGLSLATLVIEAAKRSGTSVTAKYSWSQNRKVYCIPGNLDNPKSIGTNELIKHGAKLVTEVTDIVKNYNFLHKKEKEKVKEMKKNTLGEYQDIIQRNPINIDQIIKKINKPTQEVISELLIMELEGKIKKISGNRYLKL